MQLPIGITFRNIAKSKEMEDIILAHAAKLNEFYDRVIRCDVVVELPHKHHRKGNALQVRVDVTYPGGEVVVSRTPARWADHSFTTVVGEAFDAARRQILDAVRRRQRSRVRSPQPQPRDQQELSAPRGKRASNWMPFKDREHYRSVLTDLMHRLDRELESIEEEGLQPGGGEASGGFSNVPLHLADLAAHEYDTSVNVGLAQNQQQLRREVDLALARLDDGDFGQCELCQEPVEKERLAAIPYARLCAECARATELVLA